MKSFLRTIGLGKEEEVCPYCYPITRLIPVMRRRARDSERDSTPSTYECPSCETRFEKTPGSGELEPLIPTLQGEPTPGRRTCIPLEQGKLSFESATTTADILCRTCTNHQNILLQLLSSYEADELTSLETIRSYREELERRYPLCSSCRSRVHERLRLLEYKLKSRRLAAGMAPSVAAKMSKGLPMQKSKNSRKLLSLFDIFFIQSLFNFAWYFKSQESLDWILSKSEIIFGEWIVILAKESPILVALLCYSMTLVVTFVDISMYFQKSVLLSGWAMVVGILRLALINPILKGVDGAEEVLELRIWDASIMISPFMVISFACYILLYQLHYSPAPRSSVTQKGNSLSKAPSMNFFSNHGLPLAASESIDDIPVTPVGRSTGKEGDISLKLNSALEALGPTTPLSTRFVDLGPSTSINKPSPFAVPASILSATAPNGSPKKTFLGAKKAVSTFVPRPSKLASSLVNDSGLEGVMAGFSLHEDSSSSSRNRGNLIGFSPSFFDQFVITAGFTVARLVIGSQPTLITLLLALTVALRNALWRTYMPDSLKSVINVIFLGRLVWLLFLIDPQLLPLSDTIAQLQALASAAGNPRTELFIDSLIILSR